MASPTSPEPEDGFASEDEFEAWMRAHPENADYFVELIGRAERGEFGEIPADVRDLSRVVLEKYKATEQLRVVQRLLLEFFGDLRRVHEGSPTPEALRELGMQCDGVVDAALDLPEPHRGEFLRELLPLRDSLRAIGDESAER